VPCAFPSDDKAAIEEVKVDIATKESKTGILAQRLLYILFR
jgi:hypothetical protein